MISRFIIVLAVLPTLLMAQKPSKETLTKKSFTPTQYISFNPLGLAEPQMALGIGYGTWFSRKSEIFTEASYILNQWFYNDRPDFTGMRIIGQYKYHQNAKHPSSFIGIDLRWKALNFSGKADFVQPVLKDTLHSFPFKARSNSPGAAFIFGQQFNISPKGKWYGDLIFGIGAKQRFVRYKNVEANYERIFYDGGLGLSFPKEDEEVVLPYFPFAFRICYRID